MRRKYFLTLAILVICAVSLPALFLKGTWVQIANAEQALSPTILAPKFLSSSIINAEAIPIKATGELTPTTTTLDESGQIPKQADRNSFKIIDGFVDVAEMGNNQKVFRVYSSPRLVYKNTNGELRLRPDDWTWFNDDDRSAKLTQAPGVNGYQYSVSLGERKIQVRSGNITMGATEEVINETESNFSQIRADNSVKSTFVDFYPNIDIQFQDKGLFRLKQIIIKQKPALKDSQELIFWEHYDLIDNARIFDVDGQEITRTQRLGHTSIFLKVDGYAFQIGGGTVLDASGEEKYFQPLPQIVKIDRENRILSVGIILDVEYLNDPIRVYPVKIDPTYAICRNGYFPTPPYNCNSVLDFYLRQRDGQSDPTSSGARSSDTSADLFIGRNWDGYNNYTRAAIIKFNLPNLSSWIDDGTITSAYLKMYKNGTVGYGSYNGTVYLTARRITANWQYSSITYNNIKSYLGESSNSIGVSTGGSSVYSFDIWSIVDNYWVFNPANNYGLLVEPDATIYGTNWPDRQLIFNSAEASGSDGPYLELTVEYPDLIATSCSVNQTSVNVGDILSGTLTIKNNGVASAGPNSTYYYFSQNQYPSGQTVDSEYMSSLSAGSSVTQNFSFAVPAGTGSNFYVSFRVDGSGQVAESYEDNDYSCPIPITVSNPPSSQPDLMQNSALLNQTTISPGGTLSGYVDVRNQGNASAGPSYISYSLNTTTSYSFAEEICNYPVPSVSVSNYYQQNYSCTVPTTKSPGTYYLCFDIDHNNSVAESNEYNNTYCFGSSITVTASKANLVAANVNLSSSGVLHENDTLTVQAQVQNTGSVDAYGAPYSMTIHDTYGSYQLTNLSPATVDLPAGYSNTLTFSGKIPNTIPYTGLYKVLFYLDPGQTIPDSDPANNYKDSNGSITVTRLNYGGGGGNPPPVVVDYDSDKVKDKVEATVGTNVNGANNYTVISKNIIQALSTLPDTKQDNTAGDPVNLRTGALELTQNDFKLSGRGAPIDLTRIYNSKLFDWKGRFGAGWNFSYNDFYYIDPNDNNSLRVFLDGHLTAVFTTTDGGVTYSPSVGQFDTLLVDSATKEITYKTLEGARYVFLKRMSENNFGMIDKIIDTNGNTTQFNYSLVNGIPLLSSMADASGRQITFTYPVDTTATNWDKVISIKESLIGTEKAIIDFTYNSSGQLTNAKQYRYYYSTAESINFDYTYSASGTLLTYTSPRGTILRNVYDASNRVIEQYESSPTIAERKIYSISYNDSADPEAPSSTHCATITNYRGSTSNYTNKMCFNSDELKIFEKDGQGNVQRWSYDSQGMVSQYTDQNGAITKYEYDTKRRKVREIASDAASYKTESSFVYEDNFNRLIQQITTSTPIGGGASSVKIFTFGIDAKGNIVSSTDPMGYQENFTYDSYGNPLTYVSKEGKTLSYQYDANGNYKTKESINVHQADNTVVKLEKSYDYDNYGNRSSYTDGNNNYFHFYNDSKGNIRKEVNPFVDAKQYIYDLENHRLSETNELGKVTNFTYDTDINASLLKVEKVSVSGNITNSRQYDYLGNVVDETDPLGRQTTYTYNSANRISQKSTPLNTITYTYYPNGQIKSETNSLNQKTEYYYDSRNQLIEIRRYTDTTNYISIKTNYDGFGRVISTIDANGNTTTFTYDLNDRLTSKTDALGNVTTYSYDKNGNKTGELLPNAQTDSTLRNSQGHTTSYQYDEANRLIKTINAQNKQTLRYYDGNNNLIKLVDRQNSDGTYSSHTTQYTYDALNRLTRETDPYNAVVSSTYDKVGNLLTKTDQMGRTITYTYDDFNRLISETDPANNITKYTYDKVGNRLSITYPDNKTTNYTYNQINKLLTVTDTLNNVRTFTYDVLGNKLTEKDKRGYTTSFQYDNLSRLTQETNPQNIITTYTYDNNNNRLSETVNNAKTTSYQYDKLNRITKITRPGNKQETVSYDNSGNIKTKINGNNQTITHTYDSLDRLTNKQLPTGETNVSYTYDNWNNLTQIIDESGVTVYVYNYNNQPTSETKTLSGLSTNSVISRTYNSANQLNVLTDTANRAITYTYNNRGLLDKATYNSQDLAKYTYNSNNKVQTITYGNGVTTNYTYDDLQRATKIETLNSSLSILSKQEYTYDAESNRLSLVENSVRTTTYSYDSLNQLTTADYSNVSNTSTYDLTYTYDSFGNRTQATGLFGTIGYTYASNSNELTNYSYNSGNLSVSSQYDNNGSLTKETHTRLGITDKTINYTWDSQNRLKQIIYGYNNFSAPLPVPTNTMKFTYDDNGNRTMKQSNNEITYYLNDGLIVLNEFNSLGTVTKSVINGLEQIAEINASNTIKYVHQDILGSTILITDANGNINQEYEYDPFGQIIGGLMNNDDNKNTKYLYTGQEYDQESELYYYNARYYNPIIGRFISLDPVLGRDGDVLSKNGYIYVLNNPVKYVDPTGEEEKKYMQGIVGYGAGIYQGLEDTSEIFWHPVEAAEGFWNFIKEGAKAWKDTATSLYNDHGQTLVEMIDGTVISYNQFMDLSPYDQGKAIGYFTEKIGESVVVGKILKTPTTNIIGETGEIKMIKLNQLQGRQLQSEYTGSKIKRLKNDMIENGYDSSYPVEIFEVNGKSIIVDGHHRVRAAGAAGIKEISVRSISQNELLNKWGLTPSQLEEQVLDAIDDLNKFKIWR